MDFSHSSSVKEGFASPFAALGESHPEREGGKKKGSAVRSTSDFRGKEEEKHPNLFSRLLDGAAQEKKRGESEPLPKKEKERRSPG